MESNYKLPVSYLEKRQLHQHQIKTEQLIMKHLRDYFNNLKNDLIMPDELSVNGERLTKAEVCDEQNALIFFEDAVHNYESFLSPSIKTKAILFRTKTSVWNHSVLSDGMRRIVYLPKDTQAVEGWKEASEVLRIEIAKQQT